MRRIVLAFAVAGALVSATAPPVSAHALVASSAPHVGERLESSPESVRITFTEPPDPAISSIDVLDETGRSRVEGEAGPSADEPSVLTVALQELEQGTYTVTWRVVSRVDGHLTSGSFAFGVGVEPLPVEATEDVAPPAPFVGTAGRWAFYLGLSLMIGAAWLSVAAFTSPGRLPRLLPVAGWVLAALGVAGIEEGQRTLTTLGVTEFLMTQTGRGVMWRLAGLAVAGAAVLLAWRWARLGAVLAVAGTAGAALAHVSSGHAAAGSPVGVVVQWAHMLAAAVWIGGLAALLVGLPGTANDAQVRASRRFSKVAGGSIAVVAVTGFLRAFAEVGTIDALTGTGYGRTVLIKSGLLLTLAALGAVNRYRSLPAMPQRPTLLRRVGSVELAVATGAFVASGLLSQGVPPATYAAAESAGPIVIEASDFAETIRATLEVRPGTPGPNAFTLRLEEFTERRPLDAEIVRLRFRFLSTAEVGSSRLDLEQVADGVWRGGGPNLSIAGRWRITALVQREATSSEITFEIETRSPEVEVQRAPGQPTLYTVEIGAGRTAQVYTDPERPGFSQLHLTFFEPEGTESMVAGVQMEAIDPDGTRIELEPRRFGPGHFVTDITLAAGKWRFEADGTTEDGNALSVSLEFTVSE